MNTSWKQRLPPISQLGPFIALIMACAFFGATTEQFFSGQNFSLILQQVMVVGVIAIGQTLIILTAGIDLSCGMVMALGNIVMTKFAVDLGLPVPLAIACGIAVTALFGLIKCLSGATIPDEGTIELDGRPIHFKSPIDARRVGIETVYQDLAVAPAMTIAENLFLGRELRREGFLGSVLGMLDKKKMLAQSIERMNELKVGIRSMLQAVETLSGGPRQCVAVARAAAFAEPVVILDEPTAALGVKEGNRVLELIRRVRNKGLPVILISHNMPHVFEIADRIHVARLGRRAAVLNPKKIGISDTVAVMTGAMKPEDIPAECLAH